MAPNILKNLKPGTVLQSLVFPSMQALVGAELVVGLHAYTWHLARKVNGGYQPYGPARHSEIDAEQWAVKS